MNIQKIFINHLFTQIINDNSIINNIKSLASVTLNKNLNTIGIYVFTGYTNLEEISIPESVKEIGEYGFLLYVEI